MPTKRQFRPPKTEEQEKKDLEDCIPKDTRNATKWAFKVFSEWQMSRNNKDTFKTVALYKASCSFAFHCSSIYPAISLGPSSIPSPGF